MNKILSVLVAKETIALGSFSQSYDFITYEWNLPQDKKFKNMTELYSSFEKQLEPSMNGRKFHILSVTDITDLLEQENG